MSEFIKNLAQEYGVTVVYESFEGSEAFVMGDTIFLNPDQYEPRKNWIFCHELAHLILKHPATETVSQSQEREADQLAAEIILPTTEFKGQVHSHNLAQLRQIFPHASWEAIARRRIFFRPAVLTILDNQRLTCRVAPEGYCFPRQLNTDERKVMADCWQSKEHRFSQTEQLVIEGFYIDENPEIIRQILLTETRA